MRDVEMRGGGSVAREVRWTSAHVGDEYRGRRPVPYAPPGPPVARDVGLIRVVALRPCKEPVDQLSLRWRNGVEVNWQIDHALEVRPVAQNRPRVQEFSRSCNRGQKKPVRQYLGERSRNPYGVGTCDLTTVNAKELA